MEGLTTGEDIRKLLAKCPTCYSITNNGNYVIFHSKLPQLIITDNRPKIALIVNTATSHRVIGHWFSLIFFSSGRKLFLCDGLDQARKDSQVLKNIKIFCENNNLAFSLYRVRLQLESSLTCGYIAIWWVYKLSVSSLKSFMNLRRIMLQQSIYSNEKRVLKTAKKHFQINAL